MKSNYCLCLFIIFAILSSSLQFSITQDKTTLKRGKNLNQDKNQQSCIQIGKRCDNASGRPCCPNPFCGPSQQCECASNGRCGSSSG